MPRYAANLSWLYTEWAMPARYAAAKADGFQGVECMFPYDVPLAALQEAREESGLLQVLINAPAGDWAAGERGLAALPHKNDKNRFRQGFAEQALPYAVALQCPRIHVLAGLATLTDSSTHQTYVDNLRWACKQADKHHIDVV
ncbi:MAG: hypothetical protein RLZZ397_1297, partial [Pseudomonadota bacterium]